MALSISNIRLRAGDVQYGEVQSGAIPDNIVQERYTIENCSSSDRREQKTISIVHTEGHTITRNDTLTNTDGVSVTLNIYGQQLGISSTNTVSFTSTETQNYTRQITETITVDEVARPFTRLEILFERTISTAYMDFSGTIYPEADITVSGLLEKNLHQKPFNIRKSTTMLDSR